MPANLRRDEPQRVQASVDHRGRLVRPSGDCLRRRRTQRSGHLRESPHRREHRLACAGEQQGEAECIASQHAEQRVSDRVNQQSADMLKQANESYEKKFHRPLMERKVFPQTMNFSTTAEALHVVGLKRRGPVAAADEPRPRPRLTPT